MTRTATGLWDWALAAYARPGAAEACLALQDRHGQNVPLLLWALWSADKARNPDVAAGAALARAWEDAAVAPLRAVRGNLKAPRPELADADREAVRARVKAIELEAERRLLLALEALPWPSPRPGGEGDRAEGGVEWVSPPASRPADARLVAASAAWGAPLSAPTFDDLLRCLNLRPA